METKEGGAARLVSRDRGDSLKLEPRSHNYRYSRLHELLGAWLLRSPLNRVIIDE
jgi:hypothetical protein